MRILSSKDRFRFENFEKKRHLGGRFCLLGETVFKVVLGNCLRRDYKFTLIKINTVFKKTLWVA